MKIVAMGFPSGLPLLCLGATLLLGASRVHAGNVGFSLRTEPMASTPNQGSRSERRLGLDPTSGKPGRPRLISFSTDSSQIGVELGFTVPLLKVPLQGARTGTAAGASAGPGMMAPLFKEPIDVNVGALFVAGSMLLTVMGIVPAIYHAFAKPKPQHTLHARSAADDGQDVPDGLLGEATRLLGAAEAALARRGVDAWSCGGRALCTALAGAAERVRRGGGKAGSMDLVLHGLAKSPMVSEWVSGTKLQDAASGEEDSDHCMRRFSRCAVPKDITSLLDLGRANKAHKSDPPPAAASSENDVAS